jgi:hypothetical protein
MREVVHGCNSAPRVVVLPYRAAAHSARMTTAQGGHDLDQHALNSLQIQSEPAGGAHTVFIDLDTVLLAAHQGRRGVELGVQANLADGLGRLAELADRIVVLAYPGDGDTERRRPAALRIEVLHDALGTVTDELLVVECPHAADGCDCAKPGSGLIRVAIERYGLPRRGGWFIGADQEGVVSGRGAGLHTVRIGPLGVDHLSAVHRPDYEARDLLDAANHILIEELA